MTQTWTQEMLEEMGRILVEECRRQSLAFKILHPLQGLDETEPQNLIRQWEDAQIWRNIGSKTGTTQKMENRYHIPLLNRL